MVLKSAEYVNIQAYISQTIIWWIMKDYDPNQCTELDIKTQLNLLVYEKKTRMILDDIIF